MVEVFRRAMQLFTRKLWRRTVILMAIHFCLSFSAYGVTLWYPTYVDTLQQQQEDADLEEVCNLTLANQTVQFVEGYQEQLLCDCPLTVYNNVTFVNVNISGGWLLSGGSLKSSSISGSNLTGVWSDGSAWTDVQVTNVLFANSTLSSSVWSSVVLQNVQFENSLFCDVNVSDGIKLSGVEMKDCIVNGLYLNTANDTAIISALRSSSNCSLSLGDSVQCTEPEVETDYFAEYLENFIIASSPFITMLISAVLVYYFRRSFLLCFFLASSALSSLFVLFFTSEVLSVLMLCIFNALVNPSWKVSTLLVAELYPTALRSTAMGIHLMVARVGAIIGTFSFGALGYNTPEIPIISVIAILSFGALLSLFLPKTNRQTALT